MVASHISGKIRKSLAFSLDALPNIVFIHSGSELREIWSPGYPASYPNKADKVIIIFIIKIIVILRCQVWNLEVALDEKILLTFWSFRLEHCGSCRCDFVQVSSGSFNKKYCGGNLPSPIISSGNTMTVTFHSDGSNQYVGFMAQVAVEGALFATLTSKKL